VLGNIAKTAKLGSAFAPMSNWVAGTALSKKLLGLDPRRRLPDWKRQTFQHWAARRNQRAPISGQRVTLFNDTFTNHYDPEIGIAAMRILERGGCTVDVIRPGCCGRPLISKGLLAEARAQAGQLVEALYPIAARGEKILFCEPSCLSAVKEDAEPLLRDEQQEKARTVASAALLWEEYAATLDLALRGGPRKILLHGHCHQKSMGLLEATKSLLGRIPSANVVDLDAGCCGMAGSFGYSKDHYDVSVAIANRKLLPAVKAMKSGEALVAVGTSCRHQVADLAGATAVHPAVLIRSLID
jgi:Fe-S oxidoreductase